MTAATKRPVAKISDDEREEYESGERGAWRLVGDVEEQRARWAQLARNTLDGRRRRISISIPERDLAKLRTRAAEGMPYQTLINSILHTYVAGQEPVGVRDWISPRSPLARTSF